MENPHSILKKVFGYDSFRPGQEEIVSRLLAGQDVLAVMPTGAGKSILVDAMHAILGARASRELVRTGAEKAVVCATFDSDPCQAWCEENEIECDDELIIRRQITAEGKTSRPPREWPAGHGSAPARS